MPCIQLLVPPYACSAYLPALSRGALHLGFHPYHVLTVSRTKSLGIIRRVNTDYHHGDCPTGSFWCGLQMKTGDDRHSLVGRIRSWDALIILLREPVSPLPFISHLLFPPSSFFMVSDPVSFIYYYFIFLSRRLSSWIPWFIPSQSSFHDT